MTRLPRGSAFPIDHAIDTPVAPEASRASGVYATDEGSRVVIAKTKGYFRNKKRGHGDECYCSTTLKEAASDGKDTAALGHFRVARGKRLHGRHVYESEFAEAGFALWWVKGAWLLGDAEDHGLVAPLQHIAVASF